MGPCSQACKLTGGQATQARIVCGASARGCLPPIDVPIHVMLVVLLVGPLTRPASLFSYWLAAMGANLSKARSAAMRMSSFSFSVLPGETPGSVRFTE